MLTTGLMFLLMSGAAGSPSPAADEVPAMIVIDGDLDDWDGRPTAIDDPADAGSGPIDFRAVSVGHDRHFVHLLIDFGRPINPQGLDGTAFILFDADGQKKTGQVVHGLEGVDVAVQLTAPDPWRKDRPGKGIGVQVPASDAQISPYDIGISFAPTYASKTVEFRIDRGTRLPQGTVLFEGSSFRAKLVAFDASGELTDQTEALTHRLARTDPPPASAEGADTHPWARASKTAVRMVNWNVLFGKMLNEPERFARVLKALDADIMTFQELTEKQSGPQLAAFLDRYLPRADGGRWQVVFGAGGGNLRCAVASRLPAMPAPPLAMIKEPGRPQRSVRVAGSVITVGDRPLLVGSIHLTCCGRAGDTRDQKRLDEVEAIRMAIHGAAPPLVVGGWVIAGDFNLVGSDRPLAAMIRGFDRDGSDAEIAPMVQLDGRTNATWSDPEQPFTPGRLDYMVYSGSTLQLVRSFVADTADLQSQWLEQAGLHPGDTMASDHMPLVADLAWSASTEPTNR